MDNITNVRDIKAGERFKYANVEWIKLADKPNGSGLMLTAHVLFYKAFDAYNLNNWNKSTLRRHLNTFDYDDESWAIDSVKKKDLVKFTRDLTADDGMPNYDTCKDYISLYTCNEYRKYRKYILNCDRVHWTITADNTVYSDEVRVVISDGTLDHSNARSDFNGVRPLCILKGDVKVIKLEG